MAASRRHKAAIAAAGLCVLFVVGCSSRSGLRYAASSSVERVERPLIAVGSFRDQRDKGATELGVVRGGYGNVLKRLYMDRPTAELVADAFRDALDARGLLATEPEDAAFVLSGTVQRLDCNQYFRREAHARFDLELATPDGGVVYRQTHAAERTQGTAGVGVFASLGSLRALAEEAMIEAVDRSLDDAGLRAALDAPASAPVAAHRRPGAPSPLSVGDRLEALESLRERGLLTDAEYREKRREILEDL